MADEPAGVTHEIWVWPAQQFLKVNEELKSHLDADVIALSQLIQSSSKIAKQIRLLGMLGQAYVKKGVKNDYLIFKGNPGLRPNLAGTRYAVTNPKVTCFVVGSEDIVKDAAKGTKIAIIAFVVIDIIRELSDDKFSLASLGVRILSDVLQAVAAAAVGAAAGVVLTTFGAPVVIAFAAVVVIGFIAGMLITDLDRRFQLTERARARMMAYEQQLGKSIAMGAQAAQGKLDQARQALESAGQKLDEAGQVTRKVVSTAYEIDRIWRTIEDMMNFDLQFSVR